jgi:CheY-like chemotaxis protein
MIIDDVEDNREMYALYFAYLGWEVLVASNGAEGLAMARAEHPDILVLDLAMPGMNGWEVCQQVKRDETTSAIKIIVMTAADCSAAPTTSVQSPVTLSPEALLARPPGRRDRASDRRRAPYSE